ncbi:MAG: sugar phosphate isomerase/epimerase [Thermoguttaceae bacterium]|jgi:2-keto-myo-inositol isomerase|nr:sugar phosphate isomerase/epimerase [Thermoguttaceae bacterium]
MENQLPRRAFLGALACGTVLLKTPLAQTAAVESTTPSVALPDPSSVRFCLNLGTIRNYNLPLMKELEVARDAGYRSVELWIDRLSDYAKEGDNPFAPAKLADLKKFLDGEGLQVEGGIGFATWIMNEPEKRAAGLDELKRQAEALAAIGAPCVAAPAAGPWNEKIEGISVIAERYAAVLELCSSFGVRALLELWGASPTLSRLSDGLAICAETNRADAGLLLDAYHLYRGGNSFAGLNLVAGSAMPIFHLNDYPSTPAREKLNDSDRVFPGDGVAPLREILSTLGKNGFSGALSLELFNPTYTKQMSALEQAKTGLAKMRALFA